MNEELPHGWTVVTGRDLFSFVTSGSRDWAKYYSDAGDLFIRVGNLNRNSIDLDLSMTQHVSPPEGAEGRRTAIEAGDLLISITADVGMLGVAPAGLGPAYVNQHVAIARPKKGLEPRYLAWFLASESHGQSQFRDSNRGVTKAGLGLDDIRNLSIHFPPLPEQRRIVTKLEALLAKVDASRKRLERIPVILKRFRQAVLAAACDGRLTEDWRGLHPDQVSEQENPIEIEGPSQLPSTWNWVSSSQLFEFVTSGSRGWAQYYSDSGPIFIRVGNLSHNSIDLDLTSIQHVSPPRGSEGIRTRIRVGDILVSITADVGMIALVQQDLGEAYINQHVALARPSGNIDSNFLAWFLAAASGGQRQFGDLQRGATKVGLGLDDIRAIWVARPPRGEQEEIVRRISNLFFLADQIEARYTKAKAQVDRLTQSILAKAFRGELVPQDPNDEPADALLSRLAAAPAEASAPARRRGRPPRVQPAAPPVAPAPPVQVHEAPDREAPALADLTPEAIRQAHREVLASIPSPLSEDNLLRAVALRLGYQRLGGRIKARIKESLSASSFPQGHR